MYIWRIQKIYDPWTAFAIQRRIVPYSLMIDAINIFKIRIYCFKTLKHSRHTILRGYYKCGIPLKKCLKTRVLLHSFSFLFWETNPVNYSKWWFTLCKYWRVQNCLSYVRTFSFSTSFNSTKFSSLYAGAVSTVTRLKICKILIQIFFFRKNPKKF